MKKKVRFFRNLSLRVHQAPQLADTPNFHPLQISYFLSPNPGLLPVFALKKRKGAPFCLCFAGTLFFLKSEFGNASGAEIVTTFTKVILGGETVFWAKNVVFRPKNVFSSLWGDEKLGFFRNLILGMCWARKSS